jgi:hypothetical protein
MSRDNKQPAFPTIDWNQLGEAGEIVTYTDNPGMTLRDYFAAAAINSIITNCKMDGYIEETQEDMFAKRAYSVADAMLRAREK